MRSSDANHESLLLWSYFPFVGDSGASLISILARGSNLFWKRFAHASAQRVFRGQDSTSYLALLQAEADALVVPLLDDPTFQRRAVSYLGTAAHPALRLHFDQILRQHGYSAIAHNLRLCEQTPREKGRGIIYAVDDSRMMLNIYQHSLHQLGFTSVLFEFPASALAQVCQAKPDVLLTDLNMPEITGLELTTRLRALYTPAQLPIILITTQQDQETQDAAYAAGVSAMLPKPFTVEQLGIVLQGLM